jgi:teichoic acid transport system permease protein
MIVITWFSRFLPGMNPVPISWRWLLIIPAFVLLAMFCTGMGMLFARICARAPDLRSVLPFFFNLLMVASGAMFPLTTFANIFGPGIMRLITWQPLGVYLYLMRSSLLNEPLAPLSGAKWIAGLIWALISLAVGFWYFWRAEAQYGRE